MGNPASRITEWIKRLVKNDKWMKRWIKYMTNEWKDEKKNNEWMKLWMLFSAEDMWEF